MGFGPRQLGLEFSPSSLLKCAFVIQWGRFMIDE